jgi:CheY-like chemotaxis protein
LLGLDRRILAKSGDLAIPLEQFWIHWVFHALRSTFHGGDDVPGRLKGSDMEKKILIVDDEKKIVRLVRAYLEQAGFTVVAAYDGQEALTLFRHENPNLVVLNLMLPKISGLDVCCILRRESNVPIIMLTARVEEADKLIGLELGADDYVVKPFSPRELVARAG